jgi:predicted glycosyltransferase involved in capsule biosynthesis
VHSDESLSQVTQHPKTKIIRVSGEKQFLGQAFSQNVGLRYATQSYICKVDIDYVLVNPELLTKCKEVIGTKSFVCGLYRKQSAYTGFTFFEKNIALKIGGYNENIRGWGYDDVDFYFRLKNAGFKIVTLPNLDELIYHIPHDDNLRVANYTEKDKVKSNNANKKVSKSKLTMSRYQTVINTPKYVELTRII